MALIPCPKTCLSFWLACAMGLGLSASTNAQTPPTPVPPLDQPPLLTRVFPPALQVGATSTLELRGTGIETAAEVIASRPGLQFRILDLPPLPPPPAPGARNQPIPQNQPSRLARKVEVTTATDLVEGPVEVRVVTPGGISNSRRILVSRQPVLEEKEPNNDPENAQQFQLGQWVAGVISATTDVDYFQFQATKGQRVLGWLGTNSIDSRLPGALEIIAPNNRVLAQTRDRVDSDATLDLRLPEDGTYKVRVFSLGHVEGGPDAFYLLHLSGSPQVESVHPLIVPPEGGECLVFGHGLPGGEPVAGRRDGLEQARLRLFPLQEDGLTPDQGKLPGGLLTLKPFRFEGGPVVWLPAASEVILEDSLSLDNNLPDKAQPLTLPALVAGRLEKPGDRDFYRLEAKKGEPLAIEVLADRTGTRMDFVVTLKAATDTTAQEFDDGPEPLHQQWFFNRTEDPVVRFNPPKDGAYLLSVSARDVNLNGAPHQVYALRIGPPQPSFRLVTLDPAVQGGMPRLKAGTAVSLLVLADRTGGAEGPIDVQLEGIPPGVKVLPCRIPANQKSTWLTLVGGPGLRDAVWTLRVTGTLQSSPDAPPLQTTARHAGVTWPTTQQVNNPQPARMEQGLFLATSSAEPALKLAGDKKDLNLIQGDRATVKYQVTKPKGMTGTGLVAFLETQNQQDAPVRVSNGNNGQVNLPADKNEVEFQIEARNNAKAQVLHLVPRFSITSQEDDPDNRGRRRQVTRMENGPPLQVTLVPRRPLQSTLTSQTIRAKGGEKGTVNIRLGRQGFYGPVRLVSTEFALDTLVPADKEEWPLELTLPENARPGGKPLILKAACEVLPGQTVDQELRLQFNLVAPPIPRSK